MLTLTSYYAGKIYLSYPEKINNGEYHSKVVDNGKYELFYTDTSVAGVVNYGCKQLTDGTYHSAGYVWASSPSCINKEWGSKYIEAVINSACYGIDVDVASAILQNWLQTNMGDGYEVIPRFVKEDEENIVYTLEVTHFGEHVSMEGMFR